MKIIFLRSLLLFCLSATAVNAQTNNTITNDLNKLTKTAKKEKGYVSEDTYSLMRELFVAVIQQDYSDTLKTDMSPGSFNISLQDNLTTYYQYEPLFNGRALFIWAIKRNKQWILCSHLEDSVDENIMFTYRFENGFNFFNSPSYSICGKTGDKVWQKLKLNPASHNYLEIYRSCEAVNDSEKLCGESSMNNNFPGMVPGKIVSDSISSMAVQPDSLMLSRYNNYLKSLDNAVKSLIKQQGQSITITVSDLYFKDLDNDGQDEIYWFSVSDKKLVDFKVYHLTSSGLVEIDNKNYIDALKQTNEFTGVCKLSTLNTYEPKPVTGK